MRDARNGGTMIQYCISIGCCFYSKLLFLLMVDHTCITDYSYNSPPWGYAFSFMIDYQEVKEATVYLHSNFAGPSNPEGI